MEGLAAVAGILVAGAVNVAVQLYVARRAARRARDIAARVLHSELNALQGQLLFGASGEEGPDVSAALETWRTPG